MTKIDSRKKRRRSIVQAMGTSLMSKGSTAVLQFLSLPIAARILGREEFGIYATISVSLYAVSILQIGVGPALARGIAEAAAKSDRQRERKLYLTGAALVVGLAFIGAIVAGLIISFVPVEILFGKAYGEWEAVLIPSLWTGIILLAVDLIARHTDRVREGYMEAAVANSWVAAGNLIGAVVVILGVQYYPSPSFILVAVFVPNILMRLANTVFLLRKRPWLIESTTLSARSETSELLKDGLFFSATTSVVHLVEFKLSALLVGRLLGPAEVATHFILLMLTTAFAGLLVMVGTPLWAAIVDAKAKGDQAWTIVATRRYYQYLAALTVGAGVTLIGFGPWLVPLIYGDEFSPPRILFIGHAVFLFAVGWRHVNRYLAIGLGLLQKTVAPILIGLAIGLALGIFGLKMYGLWALYLGMALGAIFVPGIVLPRLVWRELRCDEAINSIDPPGQAIAKNKPV